MEQRLKLSKILKMVRRIKIEQRIKNRVKELKIEQRIENGQELMEQRIKN